MGKTYNRLNFYNTIRLNRLSTKEMFHLENPEVGDLIFNIDENAIVVYTSEGWKKISGELIPHTIFLDDFEGPSSFVFRNARTNKWIIGKGDKYKGEKSLYISSNGYIPRYNNRISEVSHAYVDVEIPVSARDITIEFMIKGVGQTRRDYMRVYVAPITYTPRPNSLPSTNYAVNNELYSDYNNWEKISIKIKDYNAGQKKRFILSWKNDSRYGGDSIRIDEFAIRAKTI